MEALRVDLTYMIVHDLKGPLAEVIANLNLLEQEALSPVQKEYLGSAIQGVVRGFARLASMREVSIRIHTAGGPHSLHADKDLFFRIVLNLVINAIEHTPFTWRDRC